MRVALEYSVRAATNEDRQNLANLLNYETHVQRHLEWRSALDWLGKHPFKLLEQGGKIIAALACPPDPPQVSWIRLFLASSKIPPEESWNALWPAVIADIVSLKNVHGIHSIPLYYWFRSILENRGFNIIENVIVLAWSKGTALPPDRAQGSVKIRTMMTDDLESVEMIDHAAFTPIWQTSKFTLEAAFNQSAVATVAEVDGQLVGYQISTSTSRGGHIARLATLPELQGQGIGYALVRDALLQFLKRGARTITVNTQQNNLTSLAIYSKAGFLATGEEYPVYQYQIEG